MAEAPSFHCRGFDKLAPETQQAVVEMVKTVRSAADRVKAAYCYFCGEKPPHGVDLPEGWIWDRWDADYPDNVTCICPTHPVPFAEESTR